MAAAVAPGSNIFAWALVPAMTSQAQTEGVRSDLGLIGSRVRRNCKTVDPEHVAKDSPAIVLGLTSQFAAKPQIGKGLG